MPATAIACSSSTCACRSKQATFEEARDQIADKVFNQRRAGEVLKYLERLRAQAIIEWKSPSLKAAFDAGVVEAGQGHGRGSRQGAALPRRPRPARTREPAAPPPPRLAASRRLTPPQPQPSSRPRIGQIALDAPVGVAPMAGMTDTAFRRLVKRQGGCGLVVTEMVSSEGLVRGIDRTLEYAEYTEEERPVSIQIFGGDPAKMADAARIVEGMGADIVDINMGCPVPKISKHNAGCSLMRDPRHAAADRRGDGQGRAHSGHRQDAGRLERRRDQRAGAGAHGRGRRAPPR